MREPYTDAMTEFAATPPLTGHRVRLRGLHESDEAALARAAEGAPGLWYAPVPQPNDMAAEIARRLELKAQGLMAPYVIEDEGNVVGMTTFMNIDAANRRVESGHTWIAREAQGSHVNPETKLLLLTRAFEELDCIAVEFRAHFHNFRSRRAIEKLGAKLDGVLRSHRIVSGVLRDTAVYSITAAEWPTVKLGLTEHLAAL